MTVLSPLRVGRITASRVPFILGISPYGGPETAMRRMVRDYHGLPEDGITWVMERGSAMEDEAIIEYERIAETFVLHSGAHQRTVIHPEYDWLAATPDGFTGIGLVEVKCPPPGTRIRPIVDRPDRYAQIQVQLECTGEMACDYVQYIPGEFPFIETVQWEPQWLPEYIDELLEFKRQFLHVISYPELCAPHLAPLLDERTDEEWLVAAATYWDAHAAFMAASTAVVDAKRALIGLASNGRTSGGGVRLTQDSRGVYTVRRAVDR